jgi:hypothetical protein
MKSQQLDNLFPGVDAEALNKLKKAKFHQDLHLAAKAHGGLPVLSQLLRDNPEMGDEELNQSVHDLAALDSKWAESSKQLREMFPLT